MDDYEDIDLADIDAIDVQIAEREAMIERLQGEIDALQTAIINQDSKQWDLQNA